MPHDESLSPQLTGLAAALANLVPAAPAVNRDALMYRAGWAAAEAEAKDSAALGPTTAVHSMPQAAELGHWLWPSVSAVLAVATLTLGWLHVAPRLEPPAAAVEVPVLPQVSVVAGAVDARTYVRLRQQLVAHDGDILPDLAEPAPMPGGVGETSPDYGRLRHELLGG